MIVVVNDANVLIDLVKLDIIAHFFELPLVFYTTDFILEDGTKRMFNSIHTEWYI